MAKIGIVDVDGHNFPNLPLMKLSAYHKAKGDEVVRYEPLFTGHCDKVYMSKVFSFTPDYEYFIDADEISKADYEKTGASSKKVARSMIHPQYANRFIREFILEESK